MFDIEALRSLSPEIICLGNHRPIIQSMLDFDFLVGRKKPTVKAITSSTDGYERFFFGKKETLLPVYSGVKNIPAKKLDSVNLFFNANSGRRAHSSTLDLFRYNKSIFGGVIFAENVPELHALHLLEEADKNKSWIIGPASVGIYIPGHLKLGAIAGTDYAQLVSAYADTPGNVAILSASGGMTNELISTVTQSGHQISFALSFGGDRFPLTTPAEAFLQAEKDTATEYIVYYGELGGDDEYEVAELVKNKKVTKPIFTYIAGSISELFEEPPQFGHAKAMAKSHEESAKSKRQMMQEHGIISSETFNEFVEHIKEIPQTTMKKSLNTSNPSRNHAMFASSISEEKDGDIHILGKNLIDFAKDSSFAEMVVSMFLGKQVQSREVIDCVDHILKLTVDHGPSVSGAVNTIVTARAGRDLSSSLSAGLLTIGDRFGGAVNGAAEVWLRGATQNITAKDMVEEFAKQKKYIPGIGHKKYRTDNPDPRVASILSFSSQAQNKRFTTYAKQIEKITSEKKANLILNVDGTIAAVLLDLLSEKEKLTDEQLLALVRTEFFNAFFILGRSVGFIAHFLDQKRLGEGLFRLPDKDVAHIEIPE
jgi:ATP citrate (pro-S)-lyase